MSAHFVSCFAFDEQIISFNRCAVIRCDVEKTRGQEYKSQNYELWCKEKCNTGVRRKTSSRKHCFSFGERHVKDVLRDFGCVVLKKLDDGLTEEEVKA